ncbi:UDP-N-acetylmuramate--alanine ligase [Leuconostoc holzapfelii]|uniref:UDP-N-acetylmuramate--alanine ligase n=1 Tax=Leuconostoc holzapfelii TaxID=434464 RepID=A0A846ZHX1_9LACO|nr:UDP-N-acetylmuramate--alanine ligase [Leuconostoc holzapfelii]MCT8390110.1 UDP-N-acetylmuramate--alanine ligase [Leuconostoc holzapfelii]NKZ18323.1 UDP-N-acetylmuramate--alanine ligase [Leuconostoc holzapfelii]
MATQEKIQNARRTYRTLNDENAQYKKLIFELRKGELQYFTFVAVEEQ